jgi:hypothetical protein
MGPAYHALVRSGGRSPTTPTIGDGATCAPLAATCSTRLLFRGADLIASIHNEIGWIVVNPAIVNGLRTAISDPRAIRRRVEERSTARMAREYQSVYHNLIEIEALRSRNSVGTVALHCGLVVLEFVAW